MKDYIESLIRCRDLDCDAVAPGHGDLIRDPARAIDWIITHRLEREGRVIAAVSEHPNLTSHELVPRVYTDVNPNLYQLAERSLLAHLEKLAADGKAVVKQGRWREL
jgi:glyoxylase-like metal-dependent hydrolase (beta-lactamase superfamily II)